MESQSGSVEEVFLRLLPIPRQSLRSSQARVRLDHLRIQFNRTLGRFPGDRDQRGRRTGSAQRHLYVADGANGRVYVLRRDDGQVVGQFGRTGHMAGEFKWIHNLAIDAQGNLYTAEVGFGRRAQKFELVR